MSIVSIVIATYNGSPYISEQLQSILEQTYKDFEVVIIDDCSNDSTINIIKETFKEKGFTNYNITINESNIGVSKSFQKGIEKTKGKYIAISDQDDVWLNNKLELSLYYMEKYNADLVHSSSLLLEGQNKTLSIYPRYRNFKKLFALLTHNNARGATIVVKKSFLEKLMPFSNYDLYDKWIYFLSILYGEIYYIDKPLHYYRIHCNNYIGNQYKYRSKRDLISKLNLGILFYKQLSEYVEHNRDLNSNYCQKNVLMEIEDIIKFISDTSMCLSNRNYYICLIKYFQNILGREFSITEKMIYFYYYMCKTK